MDHKHSYNGFPSPGFPPDDDSEGYQSGSNLVKLTAAEVPAQYHLDLGNKFYNNYLTRSVSRDLDTAIGHYKMALEADPGLPECYVKLASALWDKGEINLDTAINYCQVALKLNMKNTEAHLFMGYFLKRSGNVDKAILSFEKSISTGFLHSAKARIALGTALIHQASLRKTAPAVQRLMLTGKGLVQFSLGVSLLPFDQKAFNTLQNALGSDLKVYSVLGLGSTFQKLGLSPLTKALYEWGAKLTPGDPVFYHHLGDLHAKRQTPDASIYYYNRALELDGENVTLYKKLGKAYDLCEDTANAARCLEKIVEKDKDFDSLYTLAQLYTEQHQYIRALYYFKEALRLQPKSPYVHSNMAYTLFKLDDYEGAIEEYQLAVLYGDDPIWTATVAQTLGTIYYQIKQDIDSAAHLFRKAHQLDPGNLDCMTMLAELYCNQGNIPAALELYEDIIQMEPENPECFNYLGYLLWQLDRNEEAIDAYLAAIHYDPDNYIAYNNLGVIYLDDMNKCLDALVMFQKAIEIKRDYTLALFNVGRCQEKLGQTALAAKTYSDTLSLNAENPELADDEILDRLNTLFEV